MKERLLAYLKENKKKVVAFVVAGIIAALGLTVSQEAADGIVNVLDSLSTALFETAVA